MQNNIKVIAIDPGYERCGVAVITKPAHAKETLTYSDCIRTPASEPFHRRLAMIGTEVEAIISAHSPDLFAIETLFFNTNQKTASKVAEVRGMLLYIAALHEIRIVEFSPLQVKQAIAGYGRGDKKQMITMIPRLIRIEKSIAYDDEYDAIAVGLTALARQNTDTIAQQ